MLSICAVIAVRNEELYLPVLLPMLAAQSIDVAIIDHQSTDSSRRICSEHNGNPVVLMMTLEYEGVYSQTKQLEAKRLVYSRLPHEWVVHQDADEILEDAGPGRSLRNAIEEADRLGYNALNFDEFVFLPEPEADYRGTDFYHSMLRYYFFEPQKNRLNRAWRRDLAVDNLQTGGHVLGGEGLRLFPENHNLRHYIMLSYEHGKSKYLHRRFGEEDLQRGWHGGPFGDRLNFTDRNLQLPAASPYLFQLEKGDSRAFRRDVPTQRHYWLWE